MPGMTSDGIPPPWIVAGASVHVVKDVEHRRVRILVPEGCMATMTDAEIVELVTFTETVRARLAEVVPVGWVVLA
jgi:hypothetical protein